LYLRRPAPTSSSSLLGKQHMLSRCVVFRLVSTKLGIPISRQCSVSESWALRREAPGDQRRSSSALTMHDHTGQVSLISTTTDDGGNSEEGGQQVRGEFQVENRAREQKPVYWAGSAGAGRSVACESRRPFRTDLTSAKSMTTRSPTWPSADTMASCGVTLSTNLPAFHGVPAGFCQVSPGRLGVISEPGEKRITAEPADSLIDCQ
jgi:hypothetical protein